MKPPAIEDHTSGGPVSVGTPNSKPHYHPRLPWPEPGNPVIVAQGLGRELGTLVKTPVLLGIDLTIRSGEFVSLTGLSGSGKSTLLYLLGALDRPTTGAVFFEEHDITTLDDDERAELRSNAFGFVFQFHFLLPEFTVLENVMIPMLRRGKRSRDRAEDHAIAVLDSIGLTPYLERRPSELSGGQQQRVSIARAVANDPKVVFADEPTGNLDSKNGILVMEAFEKLVREQGITIVMVTHEHTFAERASRQIVMSDGRIVNDINQR
ncbi:MAG: ABC transporter ATP-binding protein [Polyangiaceae bacterium]|nr:ABC transporter ATP-binding protein [Polyangiaceae bacterium]